MTIDVAVIGGGVSGTATAYALKQSGYRVAVLERQVRTGGSAISERIGGFLMEHGPSTVNAASPEALDLSRTLGIDSQRCELGAGVRYRYLVGDGAPHRIATHPLGFLTSGYLSLSARLRIMAELFVPAKDGDDEETVAAFWRRRFGREFADRVIDPLVGGLFATTADAASMAGLFPTLVDMERRYGSITRGVMARALFGGRMPARKLFSWRDGIATLPRALAVRLGPAVTTGVAVRRVMHAADGFRLDAGDAGRLDARAVVIATQPHVAAMLLEALDEAACDATATIEAPPLAVVFLGYRRPQVAHPLDGLGYLTPRTEGKSLLGAQFCSTMFDGRAPEGHVGLSGYIGGARAPDLARAAPGELIAYARAEFRDLLGARGEPVVARVRQWPRGLPQYPPGHGRRLAAIRDVETACPGLFLTGNYIAGPSVPACLAQARETAARAHAFLRTQRAGDRPARRRRARRCVTQHLVDAVPYGGSAWS